MCWVCVKVAAMDPSKVHDWDDLKDSMMVCRMAVMKGVLMVDLTAL